MIDAAKKYQTRDGHEVRIYATDHMGSCSVVGAYKGLNGWVLDRWRDDGRWSDSTHPCDLDLIEVKPRIMRTVWLTIYPHGAAVDISQADALKNSSLSAL
jgi:hypothetical protein